MTDNPFATELETTQRSAAALASGSNEANNRPSDYAGVGVQGDHPVSFQLDRYRVVALLGQGGFGITYRAFDALLQRFVAIKEFFLHGSQRIDGAVVPPDQMEPEMAAEMRAGFLEEARALARFSHAGVVRVNEVFDENQTSYIVMEFIEGRTLQAYVAAEQGLDAVEIVRLAKSLLRSLQAVHAAGLLHRDIKPANVYITSDGQPVLIDFGAARALEATGDMTVILTHHFAPIEQYGNNGVLGTYTDLYALAATLLFCFAGQLVPSAPERLQNDTFEPQMPADAPPGLRVALTKALIVQPAQRLQNAGEFLELLEGQLLPTQKVNAQQQLEAYQRAQLEELLERFGALQADSELLEKLEAFVHLAVVAAIYQDSRPPPSAGRALVEFIGNLVGGLVGSLILALEAHEVNLPTDLVHGVAGIGLALVAQNPEFAQWLRSALIAAQRERDALRPVQKAWQVDTRYLREKPSAEPLERAFPNAGRGAYTAAGPIRDAALTERGNYLTLLSATGDLELLHLPSATSSRALASDVRAVSGGGAGLWIARGDALERIGLSGKLQERHELGEPATALAVGANSLAFGTVSGRVGWLKGGALHWLGELHAAEVTQVALSSDERVIVSAAAGDDRAVVCRTDKLAKLRDISANSPLRRVSLEPGGRMLTTLAASGEVSVWDIPSGVQRRQILTHRPALDVAMLRGGRVAVLITDGTLLLHDAISAGAIACQDLPPDVQATHVCANPSGSLLCVVGGNRVLAWQLAALSEEELPAPTELIGSPGVNFSGLTLPDSGQPVAALRHTGSRLDGLAPLERRLELYRAELLDLGTRNPLLNFQPFVKGKTEIKPKRLVLTGITSDDLYRHLVVDGKGIGFEATLPAAEDDEDEGMSSKATGLKRGDLRVSVPLSPPRLHRQLTELYRTAQEFSEEQGVNCFYLVLGVVQWRDSKDPLQPRQAPLILVPVTLTRERQGGAFRLTHSDEDIERNEAFALKLKLEGLDLPNIGEEDDLKPGEYAAAVTQSLGAKYGPVMIEQTYLGFFSFAKLLMHRDLDTSAWDKRLELGQHPILAPLLSDEVNPTPPLPVSPERLEDMILPSATGHVLDADYTQSQAVLLATQGHHLVIEGPPGTGKSQTITNIIAALIAQGKRVLFVAEKEAALSVVESRLKAVGLGEATLSLHSKDANKTALRDQLARAYNQRRVAIAPSGSEGAQLDQIGAELRDLETALHSPVLETRLTPYGLYGLIRRHAQSLEGVSAPRLTGGDEFKSSHTDLEAARSELERTQGWLSRYGSPLALAFYGSRRLDWLPTDDARANGLLTRAVAALEGFKSALLALPSGVPAQGSLGEASVFAALLGELQALELPLGLRPELNAWDAWSDADGNLFKRAARRSVNRKKLGGLLKPEAWNADPSAWIATLETDGAKWYAFALGQVSSAKKGIAALFRDAATARKHHPLEIAREIALDRRVRADLTTFAARGQALFGHAWRGEDSDFTQLTQMVGRVKELREAVARDLTPAWHLEVMSALCATDATRSAAIQNYQRQHSELNSSIDALQTHLQLEALEVFNVESLSAVTWDGWSAKLERFSARSAELRRSVEWNQFAARLNELGLTPCVAAAATWPAAATHLSQAYALEVYNQTLAHAFETRPALARFSKTLHDDRVTRFQALDQAVIVQNRHSTLLAYQRQLPVASEAGQVGLLRAQFARQKRLKPIRALMLEAGRAIQALKPVFMMSPLSIASFVPLGALEFDVVLFDEASQVRPADALGALLRAKQAIVVGDQKQLGPSNFFQKTSGDDPESELEGESLLDLFISRFDGNKRSLNWHYRSQHESLIQTSNEEYYNNQLVTFPSATERSSELGLVYHHNPATHYEPGEKRRINRLEAQQVVDAVLRHATERGFESLAVVTFNQPQKKEIERLLDKLTNAGALSAAQHAFVNAPSESAERFVVKNIENVQGDERDVIMISVGSGYDHLGKMHARFGPLAQKDGGRRLNVLITRAKRRIEVFANFLPDELKVRDNGGLPGFRRFMKLAHSTSAMHRTGEDSKDALLEEIAAFIRTHGFEVHTLVGNAALSIDVAVLHPSRGGYALGIDVDSSFEMAQMKSSRDMHRLRPAVLNKLGWRLHRLWSTDWFRDPEEQKAALLEAIEAALNADASPRRATPISAAAETSAAPSSFTSADETGSSVDAPSTGIPALHITQVMPAPPTGIAVQPYTIFTAILPSGDLDFYQLSVNTVAGWTLAILKVEHPIHAIAMTRRLANRSGNTRVGARIVAHCQDVFKRGAQAGYWQFEDDALSLKDAPVPIRTRADLPVSEKQLELVPLMEINEIVRQIVKTSLGVQRAELEALVPKLLGFERVTLSMAQTMREAVDRIVQHGDFTQSGDFVTLANA